MVIDLQWTCANFAFRSSKLDIDDNIILSISVCSFLGVIIVIRVELGQNLKISLIIIRKTWEVMIMLLDCNLLDTFLD